MPFNYSVTSKHYDTIISGMGPTALASTWEAAVLGNHVLVIADRGKDFIRTQTVYVQPKFRHYLLQMKNSDEDISPSDCKEALDLIQKYEKEIRELAGITIKDIERYILYRINRLLINVDVALYSEIQTVNTITREIDFLSNDNPRRKNSLNSASCKYLVCADGAKHHAVNRVNAGLQSNQHIKYREGPAPKIRNHFTAYLMVNRVDGNCLQMHKRKNLYDFALAKQLISDHNRILTVFINRFSLEKHEGKQVKISISGEAPAHIVNIKNVNEKKTAMLLYLSGFIRKNFFSHIASDNLMVDITQSINKKYGVKKDDLKLTFFETEGASTDQPIVKRNNLWIFVVGDAFLKPNYQTGFGINGAFTDTALLGELLRRTVITENDVQEYTKKFLDRAYRMQKKTSLINLAASIPYLGKASMANFSNNNKKEMKEWIGSLDKMEQKIVRKAQKKNEWQNVSLVIMFLFLVALSLNHIFMNLPLVGITCVGVAGITIAILINLNSAILFFSSEARKLTISQNQNQENKGLLSSTIQVFKSLRITSMPENKKNNFKSELSSVGSLLENDAPDRGITKQISHVIPVGSPRFSLK